jgi:hypothetical protein
MDDFLEEICANCGLTYGSHLGAAKYDIFGNLQFPSNYCPGHEGAMDWDDGPGTVFEPSGEFRTVKVKE